MRHAVPSPRFPAAFLACWALLLATPAAAQTVEGTVREEGSRAPVARAMVSLLDARGRAVAGTQTLADGRFTLTAPAAGTYRLRAERVGRAATVSGEIALAAGRTVAFELLAGEAPVRLDALVVEAGERACSVRPDREARVAAVWEEARKALAAAEWSRRNEPRVFTVRAFSRELDPASLTVLRESVRPLRVREVSPFRSVPAERLADGGYVQRDGAENVFYAPDAEVLLSEAFLDSHCFRLERRGELLGLAFEPVRGRRLPDVAGVLWLEEKSAELRHVDYAYTGIGPRVRGFEWGGRIEFARLPDGAWYVRRWHIHMPMVGAARPDGGSLMSDRPLGLVAVKEDGAEVAEVAADDGAALASFELAPGAVVAGVVWDSTRAAPLAGARVFLTGTAHEARADSAGAFTIAGVPEGRYVLTFEHPRAAELATAAPSLPVEVTPGGAETVHLALGRPPRPVAAAAEPGGAIALPALEAVAEARERRLRNAGFYDRKRVGTGAFLTTEAFVRRSGARVMDRIQGLRGTYLRATASASPGSGRWVFVQYRQGSLCWAPLWIDGMLKSVAELERIPPEDVEAVEVYSPEEVPFRFALVNRGGRAPCGAVVVWLKNPTT